MISKMQAIELLKRNEVLILPSDTLYGLAALAYEYEAVKKVFDYKKRCYSKQLPVHYYSCEQIAKDCVLNDQALVLAEQYWPGALTLILEKKRESKLKFTSNTVAVRIPNCDILLEILESVNSPIVMPSANLSNEPNCPFFDQISEIFQLTGIKQDYMIKNQPSTIVSCIGKDLKVLRKGVIKL